MSVIGCDPDEDLGRGRSCRPAVELLFDAMMKRKKKGKKNSKLIWYLESAVEEAHKLALTHFPPPTPPTRSRCDIVCDEVFEYGLSWQLQL